MSKRPVYREIKSRGSGLRLAGQGYGRIVSPGFKGPMMPPGRLIVVAPKKRRKRRVTKKRKPVKRRRRKRK
jgi:hypothetical protein